MKRAMKLLSFVAVMAGSGLLAACDAPAPQATPEKSGSAATAKPSSAKPLASAPLASAVAATPPKPPKGPFPESTDPLLKDPAKATAKAPDVFRVTFDTTVGAFDIECTREWGPNGVDRLYNLVKMGFFDDVAFFRTVKTPKPFVVQFGIHGNPEVSKAWQEAKIPADEVKQSNTRGMVTFAMAGSPDTRTTQMFINFGDNSNLDAMKFPPVCKVVEPGMEVVEKIHGGYGERITSQQGTIMSQGNNFLRQRYPELDYIKTARLVSKDDKKDDDKKDDKKEGDKKEGADGKPEKKPEPKPEKKPEPKPLRPPPPT